MCPCGGDLEPCRSDDELVCQDCSRQFDYVNGILALQAVPLAGGQEQVLQMQEEWLRDRQARYYDAAMSINLPSWLEAGKISAALNGVSVKAAVELGCGTGRFTVQLAGHCQRLIAIDRSLHSLEHCRLKLLEQGLADRILLIHSDVGHLPVKSCAFELALMAQVLQHLPTEALRRIALERVAQSLGLGGLFILSAYAWTGREYFWRQKQGLHRGGIFYHHFAREELQELLAPFFDLKSVESCLGKLWVASATRKELR